MLEEGSKTVLDAARCSAMQRDAGRDAARRGGGRTARDAGRDAGHDAGRDAGHDAERELIAWLRGAGGWALMHLGVETHFMFRCR